MRLRFRSHRKASFRCRLNAPVHRCGGTSSGDSEEVLPSVGTEVKMQNLTTAAHPGDSPFQNHLRRPNYPWVIAILLIDVVRQQNPLRVLRGNRDFPPTEDGGFSVALSHSADHSQVRLRLPFGSSRAEPPVCAAPV